MNELLKKIYDNILTYEKHVITAKRQIDNDIQSLLIPYKKQLTKEEFEKLQDLMYSVSYSAEHTGFELGIWFVIKLLVD